MAFLCVRKNSDSSKREVLVEGGPLTVTEVCEDALIQSLLAGAVPFSLWNASRAACADFSSAATIVDHDCGLESHSICSATRPTCAPARKAIRTDSTARGRSAVNESAEATDAAAIKPVQRPTNRASVLGCMYEGVLSSKALRVESQQRVIPGFRGM